MALTMTHLDALNLRLSNERARLAAATEATERHLRAVWVAQVEREIAGELEFLGLEAPAAVEMSDEELLKELGL